MCPIRSDSQIRIAKIGATQAIIVALISTLGGAIGGFMLKTAMDGSQKVTRPQRWLIIHNVTGENISEAKVVARVNSIIYSYPADAIFARVGGSMPEQKLPLPIDDEYTVSFEAFYKEGEGKIGEAKSRVTPMFKADNLPKETQQYKLLRVVDGIKQEDRPLIVEYSLR